MVKTCRVPEATRGKRFDALKPRVVVAGHKNPKSDDDGSRVVSATHRYILDFEELAEKATSAKALYDTMLSQYPGLAQPRRSMEFRNGRKRLRMTACNTPNVARAPEI